MGLCNRGILPKLIIYSNSFVHNTLLYYPIALIFFIEYDRDAVGLCVIRQKECKRLQTLWGSIEQTTFDGAYIIDNPNIMGVLIQPNGSRMSHVNAIFWQEAMQSWYSLEAH